MTESDAANRPARQLRWDQWVKLGLLAVGVSTAAVLITQVLALALWPELASFGALDSYVRSALFTLIPAAAATALLAWLVARSDTPTQTFIKIAAVVLVVSIVPDFALPITGKTLLGSTVAALLHVVAATAIVAVLVGGYRREEARRR